jgi:hypothetical protein
VLNAKKMNRILTTYLIFFTVFAFSQDSTGIQLDSLSEEKQTVLSDTILKESSKLNDTIILDFDKRELLIPLERDKLTKVVMVKEKSKIDWLKYLLPIFTLILGIILKELFEKRSNKKQIKKSGGRWIAELYSLEEPLKRQIQSLKEYLEEHKKEDFKIQNLERFSSVDGDVFNSLDKNELIKFIELNNKKVDFKEIVKISNRTNGYVTMLIHLSETLKEKFNRYRTESSKHTTSISLSLQLFTRALSDYEIQLEKELNFDPINDPRLKPFLELYDSQIKPFLQEGNFNPFLLRKDFFQPMVAILAMLRQDTRTKELSSSVTKGLTAIKGLEMEKSYLSENLKYIITGYDKQLLELENVINKIN